ncbi:MAG: ATP-dependent DNA helicase, partial [Candidatus Thermoplasmatota archaeon]|nr:ATP-dependent DNA helicase [Candidatus Thermoplasmatota archaeon]
MPPEELTPDVRFLAHDSLREGQIDMINDGLKVISEGGFLLANAPTGIGKTAAALASALTVAKSTPGTSVLFLTDRQSQHRIVVDTVRSINARLADGESPVTLVDMIGQNGMCVNDLALQHTSRFRQICGELRGTRQCKPFLADSPGLRLKVLDYPLHVDELVGQARNWSGSNGSQPTCPWKIARETASQADILVCDYNHLFNEETRKSSLKAMGLEMEKMIVIIDEAHNLPNRIRRGLSRTLNDKLLRDTIYELEEYGDVLKEKGLNSTLDAEDFSRVSACQTALKRFKGRLSTWIREQRDLHRNPGDVGAEIEVRIEAGQILAMLRQELAGGVSEEQIDFDGLISLLFLIQVDPGEEEEELATDRLAIVLSILNRYAQSSAMCVVLHSRGDENRITTHLLDPSIVSQEVFQAVRGGVLMSGTLTPPDMYAESLGVPSDRPRSTVSYSSPFLDERRPVLIASNVTSLYSQRGPENTRKIQQHIRALLQNTPGHVAVFCQSYRMLEEIVEEADWPGRMLLIESRNWNKKRVDKAMQQLSDARTRGSKVILAGVFGGRLAEGVDYSENILDAVVCVGIPVAPPSVPQNALREYIEKKHGSGKGWKYGAIQPAVNSVLQGMGRAIRKVEDRAFILLLDNRLLGGQYRTCLPPTLHTFTTDDSKRTGRRV